MYKTQLNVLAIVGFNFSKHGYDGKNQRIGRTAQHEFQQRLVHFDCQTFQILDVIVNLCFNYLLQVSLKTNKGAYQGGPLVENY